MINYATTSIVNQWTKSLSTSTPTFSLSELILIVSKIEDEIILNKVKLKIDTEKNYTIQNKRCF